MKDYEFPIPTLHVRVEELSQIENTDVKFVCGKLLKSINIPFHK